LNTVAVPNYSLIQQNLNIEKGELTYLRESDNSPQDNKTDKNIEKTVKQVQQYPTPQDTPKPAQLGGQDQDEELNKPHELSRLYYTLSDISSTFNPANIIEEP